MSQTQIRITFTEPGEPDIETGGDFRFLIGTCNYLRHRECEPLVERIKETVRLYLSDLCQYDESSYWGDLE